MLMFLFPRELCWCERLCAVNKKSHCSRKLVKSIAILYARLHLERLRTRRFRNDKQKRR